jgi:hypothetical protein
VTEQRTGYETVDAIWTKVTFNIPVKQIGQHCSFVRLAESDTKGRHLAAVSARRWQVVRPHR